MAYHTPVAGLGCNNHVRGKVECITASDDDSFPVTLPKTLYMLSISNLIYIKFEIIPNR